MMNVLPGMLSLFKERCSLCVRKRHHRCFDVTDVCKSPQLGLNISVISDQRDQLMRVFVTTSGVQVERLRNNHCTAVDAASVKSDAIRKYARISNDEQSTPSEQSPSEA